MPRLGFFLLVPFSPPYLGALFYWLLPGFHELISFLVPLFWGALFYWQLPGFHEPISFLVQDVMKESNTTLAKQWCGVDEDTQGTKNGKMKGYNYCFQIIAFQVYFLACQQLNAMLIINPINTFFNQSLMCVQHKGKFINFHHFTFHTKRESNIAKK